MIIIQCPDCSGVLTDEGIIWQCDDVHPEELAHRLSDDGIPVIEITIAQEPWYFNLK